jgi:hypothetical protein
MAGRQRNLFHNEGETCQTSNLSLNADGLSKRYEDGVLAVAA